MQKPVEAKYLPLFVRGVDVGGQIGREASQAQLALMQPTYMKRKMLHPLRAAVEAAIRDDQPTVTVSTELLNDLLKEHWMLRGVRFAFKGFIGDLPIQLLREEARQRLQSALAYWPGSRVEHVRSMVREAVHKLERERRAEDAQLAKDAGDTGDAGEAMDAYILGVEFGAEEAIKREIRGGV